MSKINDEFLAVYRTYENQLRARNTEYREIEEKLSAEGGDVLKGNRMRMMRQLRNYLVHSDDPGFIEISQECLKALQQMVKEESLRGDMIKNHLVTPAKGSIKEGTLLSKAVYRMVMMETSTIPVYGEDKRLKGILMLEKAAYALDKNGNVPVTADVCGPYGSVDVVVSPDTSTAIKADDRFVCCTKDGTLNTQYLGYLDK